MMYRTLGAPSAEAGSARQAASSRQARMPRMPTAVSASSAATVPPALRASRGQPLPASRADWADRTPIPMATRSEAIGWMRQEGDREGRGRRVQEDDRRLGDPTWAKGGEERERDG